MPRKNNLNEDLLGEFMNDFIDDVSNKPDKTNKNKKPKSEQKPKELPADVKARIDAYESMYSQKEKKFFKDEFSHAVKVDMDIKTGLTGRYTKGKFIVHKHFGEGKIINVVGDELFIKFINKKYSEKIFIYPQCVERGYIKLKNDTQSKITEGLKRHS